MCGRFSFAATDKIIEEHFGFAPGNEYIPSHNVAPGQKRPIITNENSNRFSHFNWGYLPFWTKEIGASIMNGKRPAEEKFLIISIKHKTKYSLWRDCGMNFVLMTFFIPAFVL
jgi:putative SOS response-associated peptidase YedK